MKRLNGCNLLRAEQGGSLIELAFLLPLFLLLAFGAIDAGRAFYLSIEIAGAARAGAVYGSTNPTDTTGIKTAAQDDAPDVPNLSVSTPTYGCECATDSTTYSASCSKTPSCASGDTVVYRVNVTVTGTYTPVIPWKGINSSWSFSNSATMRSAGS